MKAVFKNTFMAMAFALLPLGLQAHVAGVAAVEADNTPQYVDRGDINGDGYLSVTDVMLMVQVIFGQLSTYDKYQADVNDDDEINVTDVMTLVRWIFDGHIYLNADITTPIESGTPGGGWVPAQAPQNNSWEQ